MKINMHHARVITGNNDRITKQDTNNIRAAEIGTTEKNYAAPFFKARKLRPHAEKSQILDEDQKIDDQKFLFYGQAANNEDQKVRHWYGPTANTDDQKFLFYGQSNKNEDQKVRHSLQERPATPTAEAVSVWLCRRQPSA